MFHHQPTASHLLASFTLCVALGACDSERGSTPPQEETPAAQHTARRASADPAVTADPAETRAALRSLYSARHTKDLPSRESIEAHPEGEDAVRWLAQHDDAMAVRARALASLQMFPNDDSEAVLREAIGTPDNPATIRSAALRALKGWDLSQREDLRSLAISGLSSEDIPVAAAAAQVLANVPEASEALEQRLSESPPPAVERAIRDAL